MTRELQSSPIAIINKLPVNTDMTVRSHPGQYWHDLWNLDTNMTIMYMVYLFREQPTTTSTKRIWSRLAQQWRFLPNQCSEGGSECNSRQGYNTTVQQHKRKRNFLQLPESTRTILRRFKTDYKQQCDIKWTMFNIFLINVFVLHHLPSSIINSLLHTN